MDIILRPRITEKSGLMNEKLNLYTFEVSKNASKPMIAKAVKALYKVTALKIRTVNLPAKKVFVRGTRGTQSGVKKALVYLKKGDKIVTSGGVIGVITSIQNDYVVIKVGENDTTKMEVLKSAVTGLRQ